MTPDSFPQDALANGVSNISFGDLSGNLGRTMYQYNFQIPAYYTLLVCSGGYHAARTA
jgi:aarF domain-containing kinase